MPICIYCDRDKDEAEMSLEHAIPKFLGGAYAPERFKIDRVCERCNNFLGLFVDGSFARTSRVQNFLHFAAFPAYDSANPIALPLICMGPSDLAPPGMQADAFASLGSDHTASRFTG